VLGARWALIGFIPLTMFSKLGDGLQAVDSDFGTLLSGGGRVGWGDSVNRMWTHAILLVLMLFIVRVMQWAREDEADDGPGVDDVEPAGRSGLSGGPVHG
jgi:hypothetical protein